MARVLIIESGDDWRALSIPEDWATDDVDRYLNGMAYGRAAVVNVETMVRECDHEWANLGHRRWCPKRGADGGSWPALAGTDSFLPVNGGGKYGGGSV